MRSIKTKLLLVVAALAITAVAAPAGAAAEVHWTKEGAPLKQEVFLTSTGNQLTLNSGNGGISCTGFEAGILLNANSNKGAYWPSIKPGNCSTFGGKAFCQINSISLLSTAWGIAGGGSKIGTGLGAGVVVKYKEGVFCVTKEDVYSGGYWLNVDNPSSMSYWTPTGSVQVVEDGVANTATINGKYVVNPAKTYGMAE
jgi:hypothetical protein